MLLTLVVVSCSENGDEDREPVLPPNLLFNCLWIFVQILSELLLTAPSRSMPLSLSALWYCWPKFLVPVPVPVLDEAPSAASSELHAIDEPLDIMLTRLDLLAISMLEFFSHSSVSCFSSMVSWGTTVRSSSSWFVTANSSLIVLLRMTAFLGPDWRG